MKDSDDDWPSGGHQREVFGMRNGDFTALVPTRTTQTVSLRQRQEVELARPAKPPVNTSTLRHELIHPGISEEDMFKDEYEQEKERKRYTSAKANIEGIKELVGICVQMCPQWDRFRRANNKSAISTYEVDENGYFGESRAVKSWHRPAAGDAEDLPEDLRTEETLIKTMDYLVHDIITKWSFANCQIFVWDRTRSIRQDCSIQGLNSDAVIECYERIARFHIFSIQQLSHIESFQRGQELEQLSKTLISLNELYDDRRRLIKQGKRQYNQDNDFEAEFRAYTLVSNLHNPLQIARAIQLPSRITETPIFKLALRFFKFVQRANHDDKNLFGNTSRSEVTLNWSAQFFDLVYDPSTPYLLACLAAIEFANVKKGAIKAFERGFPPQKTASSLTFLKELVDAPLEQDVKLLVERYGLKTTEHNGMLYMNSPRKSQPSTWIAQPPVVRPPFPFTVENKRGQDTTGQFVPARLFIDEPGCYRRVVSQLCDDEVDIRYHDPVEHEPTVDGPVHIVQFASSWESVGSIVHDATEKLEDDFTGNALFDLIQNTRGGNVPMAQAENLMNYVGQRRKSRRKHPVQAPARTFKPRAPQPQQQQAPSVFQGFPNPAIPSSAQPIHQPQPQNQFQATEAPSAFPSTFPSQPAAVFQTQDAVLSTAPVASAFGAKPQVVSAFGGPVSAPTSAFGTRPAPAPAPAFGAKVGAGPVVSAFGTRANTPPISAFGQKPVGAIPEVAPAFRTGSPAPTSTPPPPSAFPSTANAFPSAAPTASVFAPHKPAQAASIFDTKPSTQASLAEQKPAAHSLASDPKPTPVSLFNQLQSAKTKPLSQDLFSGAAQQPGPPLFAPQPTLNPTVPSFAPSQPPESKTPQSVFDQPKPALAVAPRQSIFNLEPPRQPVTSFFPTPSPDLSSIGTDQQPIKSVFESESTKEPVKNFFTTTTPAAKPPAPLFPLSSTTPQLPPPESLLPSTSTTPQVPPPSKSIFDQVAPKVPVLSEEQDVAAKEDSPFGTGPVVPKESELQTEIPDQPELIEVERPESPKARLARSGLPLEEDLPDNHDLPPPHSFTYRDVIQPIPSEFFRKLDTSRDWEPWYPGIDSLDKIKYGDILELGRHRQALKNAAWHELELSECNPDGLPALLKQPAPDTWQLQIVCADEGKKSLDWFMNKFEKLVKRDNEDNYRDLHVASSHMRGQDGCIGGVIFGCTPPGKDAKETKKALKRNKGVLERTVANALRLAPKGKLQVLVIAYKTAGRTRKAQLEYIRKWLGVPALEEGGKVVVKVLVLEFLEDLEKLHKVVKNFGVGIVEKKKEQVNGAAPLAIPTTIPDNLFASTKKRELEELEAQTAKLLLDADSNAMKRRRYAEEKKPVYIYGLPAFGTPLKKIPQQQAPRKRKSIEDISDSKKRKVKAVSEKVSKALNSVSAKFDAWSLPDGEDDLMIGGCLPDEYFDDFQGGAF
ncbi:hypothetical protein ABW20_dc0106847 [Dactylellina cionopaga]|nr:hypothetical protein ABW20_dc0106847 [Dactylellina cionopaga]